MHNLCVYLEILSLYNADIFLLYIPSKYEIAVTHAAKNTYKISYLELDKLDYIVKDYAGEPDKIDLEKAYDEIELEMSPDKKNKDGYLVEHLEESYKRPIELEDINRENIKDIKDIFRQVSRLRFCVQGIKYKLAIQFKNYMICITRNDDINSFTINHYNGLAQRQLFIIVDLETLYNKIDYIQNDINTVREGIYRVLDKNQNSNTKILIKLFEEKSDISGFSESIQKKKNEYSQYIKHLETILFQLCNSEKNIIEKLMISEEKYNEMGLKGLHSDIERSHINSKYEHEIEEINLVKQEIIKTLLDIKNKHNDTFLFIDKILFDNSVMLDAVFKNIAKAEQYSN